MPCIDCACSAKTCTTSLQKVGGLLPSRYRVSEYGVDYSYRDHLDFVPDCPWFDYAYDPQDRLQQPEKVAEGYVECTATLEGTMSL